MRRGQRGFTLLEIMVAIAVLALMLAIGWTTISQMTRSRQIRGAESDRYREARNAMHRISRDLSMAYLSANEDRTRDQTRTFFVGEDAGDIDRVRFSALVHERLYADANESDQTVIQYYEAADRKNPSQKNLMRREARRPEPEALEELSSEAEILFTGVEKLEIQYYLVKDNKGEWEDTWDTQSAEGQAGKLPDRVRVKLTFKDQRGKEVTLVTQTRPMLQEVLQFYAN